MQSAIDGAKKEGSDTIVVLGHLGINQLHLSSHEIIPRLSGVNLFLDGHSHDAIPSRIFKDKDGKDVTLTQAGAYLSHIGLGIIKADGTISAHLLDDGGIKSLIAQIQTGMDVNVNHPDIE